MAKKLLEFKLFMMVVLKNEIIYRQGIISDRYVFLELSKDEVLPNCIQFYNKKSSTGPEVAVSDGKAKIPDYLLMDCLPIMALACAGEPGSTKVITRREFKVIKRVRPENYLEDPEDQIYDIIYDGGEES